MTGRVLGSHFVEIDDDTLAALSASDGKAWIIDPSGCLTAAELHFSGGRFVLRAWSFLARPDLEQVEVRLRGVRK